MQLSYRGNQYNYEPSAIPMEEGEMTGKYRGQAWKMRYPRHINVVQPVANLKYRGVSYCTTRTGGVETTSRPTSSADLSAEWATIHRANLLKNLERRLIAAKTKGDRDLIDLLQQECNDLGLACPV